MSGDHDNRAQDAQAQRRWNRSAADPTRRRIVALIALGQGQPSKVAVELGLSRPATSRQLRLLAQAGLVSARPGWVDRRTVIYYVHPVRVGQITAWLAGTEVGQAFSRGG